MFFKVTNNHYVSSEHLRTSTLLRAYYIVQKYPLHTSELLLDKYIQQQYKVTLKNMCIKLILNLTFYEDDAGNIIFIFKDPKYDKIARLITYGNGVLSGSRILKTALNS